MNIRHVRVNLLVALLLIGFSPNGSFPDLSVSRQAVTLTGHLSIVWRDVQTATGFRSTPIYFLSDESGRSTRLFIPDTLIRSISIGSMSGARVIVEGGWHLPSIAGLPSAGLDTQSIRLAPAAALLPTAPAAVLGPQPFVTVLCKFNDIVDTPRPLAYFDALLGSTDPGLDHYFRTISYGAINLSGSKTVGWYTLPHPRSDYFVPDIHGDLDLVRAAQDCSAAADADVNFPNFAGINFVFNGYPGGPMYGGGIYLTLDGVNRVWRATWLFADSYGPMQGTVAHEMGHSFGLMHSATQAGRPSLWDIMSASGCFGGGIDPLYNCFAQGTISYHVDKLGWMPSGRKYVSVTGSQATFTLEQLVQPPSNNYLMAQIPIGGSSTNFYTLEARRLVGYDRKLPGPAVLIHKVDTTRSDFQARLIDYFPPYVDPGGLEWLPGMVFTDTVNGITVCIDRSTATGFVVTVGWGVPVTCAFPVDLSPSELLVSTAHPNASDPVTFSIILNNWGGGAAAGTVVTATIPNHMTYVPDSAGITQGSVSGSGPLIFSAGTISYSAPVTLTFSAAVDAGLSAPTVLNGPVAISWQTGSLSRSFTLVANGLTVYLPLIQR